MKYYSDVLDKLFETEDELKKAESLVEEEKKKNEELKKVESKEKKQLSQEIEKADKELDEAYLLYEKAKQDMINLKKETDKKCAEILDNAKKQLKEAQNKKFDCIKKFNDQFGPYKVSYTGDRALTEMNRHFSWFDDLISNFFNF